MLSKHLYFSFKELIGTCEGICQVSESLASPSDCQLHEGALFNDVLVSGGPDLAPCGHCECLLSNKSTTF